MTRSTAQNIVNQETYISEEEFYLKEIEIVCDWIKLEASSKKSGTYMSGLSNEAIKFLRKNKFTIEDNADGSHWISWSEPSE